MYNDGFWQHIILNSYRNVAMEGVTLLFVFGIFMAVLLQKNKLSMTQPFVYFLVAYIALIICQICEWVFAIKMYTPQIVIPFSVLQKILYMFDFMLSCLVRFFFYEYLVAHVKYYLANHKDKNKKLRLYKIISVSLIIWYSLSALFFSIFMWAKGFIVILPDGIPRVKPEYIVIMLGTIMCNFINIVIILKNRKLLGKLSSFLFFTYTVVHAIILPLDLFNSTCFSYVLSAVLILLIYIQIDIQRGNKILESEALLAKQKLELAEKQTELMISQIQPHFMYNTLSVIGYLCDTDAKKAHETINNFSAYLRTNLESMQSKNLVPFEKELEHTKIYLDIEQLRFGDILKVEYDIEYSDFLLPSLILQPIVENAVKYGIRGKEEGGTVLIATKKNDDNITVTVSDNGIGFDVTQHLRDGRIHVGIENVRERLNLMCGGRLSITSTLGAGTVAVITLGGKT